MFSHLEYEQFVHLDVGDASVPMSTSLCFVCEAPLLVIFRPCGHTIMCVDCASRVKKCPDWYGYTVLYFLLVELFFIFFIVELVSIFTCGVSLHFFTCGTSFLFYLSFKEQVQSLDFANEPSSCLMCHSVRRKWR